MRYTYTYTNCTSSYTSNKPAVGVGDGGIGNAAAAKNYQLSVKPRLRLGFIYPMRRSLIPTAQAEPAEIYTTQAEPTPNEAALMAFDDLVKRTREIIKPNRNVKRMKKPNKSYSINYKRL